MQPDRRLVEDVGDVGERRPEVPDHLRALRLAAGQRAGGPVEREVAEADVDERVEQVLQVLQQRRDGRLVQRRAPSRRGRVICIAHASAMLTPAIFDARAPSLSRVPPHSGHGGEGDRSLDERADVRLHRVHDPSTASTSAPSGPAPRRSD